MRLALVATVFFTLDITQQPPCSYEYGSIFLMVAAFESAAYAGILCPFLAFLGLLTSLCLLQAWLIFTFPLALILNLFFEALCVFTLGI